MTDEERRAAAIELVGDAALLWLLINEAGLRPKVAEALVTDRHTHGPTERRIRRELSAIRPPRSRAS